MGGKEYLQCVWLAPICLTELIEERKRIRKDIENLQAMDYTSPKASKSRKRDTSDKMARLNDAEEEVEKAWEYWTQVSVECGRIISGISCGRNTVLYREILRLRYVCHMTWEQIAVKTKYSYRQVIRIHGKALQKFEEAFKSAEENGKVTHYERSSL